MATAVTVWTPERKAAVVATLKDPVSFARKLLRSDVWPIQAEILRSIAENRRTAVKACHASGKTFLAALAVLWWLARWPKCVVVTTAPTATQIEKLLWGEIHSALGRSVYPFPKPLLTELKINPDRYALGFSTSVTKNDQGVRFQGFHSEKVLVVIDESPGVHEGIWESIEGARAGGDVHVLALGNPTIASGPFHDAFTTGRNSWNTFTISAFDTPNLEGLTIESLLTLSNEELDINQRPYLTTRRWVREKYEEWGPGHPLWESRVLGQFPQQAEDALLSLAWLEAASISELSIDKAKARAGLDVAGPGEDETVLTVRRGPRIILQKSWATSDPRGEVVAALTPYRDADDLESVNVDSIGIGWGMHCHLLECKFPSVAVNVSETPRDTEKFSNLKAELYWGLRLRAQAGDFSGKIDEKTIGQLAGIRYKHNARGQIVIESKDDAKKRGVKSPDRAESIMLAYADCGLGGLIYRTSFTSDLIYNDADAPAGLGNAGWYQERVIAVAYGAAKPMCFLEIMDTGPLIYVAREYFVDGATSVTPKGDGAYVADLSEFIAGRNVLTGAEVVRSQDITVIVDEKAANFRAEMARAGIFGIDADTELLEGIQLVGSVFEKKMVRVSSSCTHFIAEHQSYAWDAQKAVNGVEEPVGTKQAVEAFRHYVKTRINPWRLAQ